MRRLSMGFPERLKKIRTEKGIGFPELARMTNIHATQLRRYEKGTTQPTLDAIKKLLVALNVPGDDLLFDEEERQPPEDFILQMKALSQLPPEDKGIARALFDGLWLRHQAKVVMNINEK